MKFPSLKDYMDVQNSTDSNIDKIFNIIVSSIESIYSGDEMFDASTQSKKDLLEFIESLSAEQFKKVQAFLDEMPAVYINTLFECENCGHRNETDLKGLANFFG
jgi:DNA phosphorothioation-dependent restriction protein DptG